MVFTAYSAGLRVSEIVNLKIKDIDNSRMQIFIQRAKGKKIATLTLARYYLTYCGIISRIALQGPDNIYLNQSTHMVPIQYERCSRYLPTLKIKLAYKKMWEYTASGIVLPPTFSIKEQT
jgi:site-specific recombinase XerD